MYLMILAYTFFNNIEHITNYKIDSNKYEVEYIYRAGDDYETKKYKTIQMDLDKYINQSKYLTFNELNNLINQVRNREHLLFFDSILNIMKKYDYNMVHLFYI